MESNVINLSCPLQWLALGYEGESGARPQTFDFSAWAEAYGEGVLQMLLQRPGDAEPYPVLLSIEGSAATWTPSATDTAAQGQGQAQLVYTVDGVVVKNAVFRVLIGPSLGAAGDPPDPFESWLTQLQGLAAETQRNALDAAGSAAQADTSADAAAESAERAESAAGAAEAAAGHYPAIIEGVWHVWDVSAGEYVSTGIPARGPDGVSPTVAVSAIDGGHRVTITDAAGTQIFDVLDGAKGDPFTYDDFTPEQLADLVQGPILDAQTAAVEAVQAEAQTQTAAVNAAGAQQVQAVEDKGEEVLESIPQDYTALSAQVNANTDALDTKAPAIYETVGPAAIASFDDGADGMTIKTLTIDLPVMQEGSGDPSPDNVRPIVGRTGATVDLSGENLIDVDKDNLLHGRFDTSGAVTATSSPAARHTPKIPIKGGITVTAFFGRSYTVAVACTVFYDRSGKILLTVNQRNHKYLAYDVPENAASVAFSYFLGTYTGITLVPGAVSPEEHIPYDGSTIGIAFPVSETVYGGTLTVNSDGTGALSALPHFASYAGETLVGPWVSSMDSFAAGATPTTGAEVVDLGGTATVYPLNADQVQTILAQLKTLYGVNNVWSDAGDVTVEYPADTKLYIDAQTNATRSMIAGIETDMTASRAYSVGELLIVGDTLYKVIAAIASGATLTPGTNVTATTVVEQLLLLANA